MKFDVTYGAKYADSYCRYVTKSVLDIIKQIEYLMNILLSGGTVNISGPDGINFFIKVNEIASHSAIITERSIGSLEVLIPKYYLGMNPPQSDISAGLNAAFSLANTEAEINLLMGIPFGQIPLSTACSIIGKKVDYVESLLNQPDPITEMGVLEAAITNPGTGKGDATCDLQGFMAWAILMRRYASKNPNAKPVVVDVEYEEEEEGEVDPW